LQLIQYLIKNGNKRILKDLQESLFLIKMLEEFNCIDQGADRGAPIKELAKKTTKMIQDNIHLLKEQHF
jgi:ENTH domain